MSYSIAFTSSGHAEAAAHLLRKDGQEDLCFALWYPSRGKIRTSALISSIIFPHRNDRQVHGNASFNPSYFERSLGMALEKGAGLAFMHSHPGPGWQDMSPDDIEAESGRAAATQAATGLPLVGLTLANDHSWSGRFWEKVEPKLYQRKWCETVRVIGDDGLVVTFMDKMLPPPKFRWRLHRTISAWGLERQQKLARLKIGVVGLGSVGSIVAEGLARLGVQSIKLIDFDSIEEVNLDRILHSRDDNIGQAKVSVIAEAIKKSATAKDFRVAQVEYSVVEKNGFREILDCDLLFSCVDRPWPRSLLNQVSFAHLIPVIDGGINVTTKENGTIKAADWKAHAILHGRRCLECLGQYDPGLVQAEREGYFDDPSYIKTLNVNHPIRQNQNVFTFGLDTASLELLQMLSIVISPLGISDLGEFNYHFVSGFLDANEAMVCKEGCPYPGIVARGDNLEYIPIGRHMIAEKTRENRARQRGLSRRIGFTRIFNFLHKHRHER